MFYDWAKNPPAGWNSWDCYGAGVTEQQLKENADYMAKNLKQYGWEYIVCDIQWFDPYAKGNYYNVFPEVILDEYGRLLPAENRFPSSEGGKGFKPIADYIHSLGLKFGIHILRGIPRRAVYLNLPILGSDKHASDIADANSICPWNSSMYGLKNCDDAQLYYDSIISLYASWDVDFIKCDDIAYVEGTMLSDPYSAYYEIEMIRKAIDKTGREIILSLSPGPAQLKNYEHLSAYSNMWRMTGDFWDSWDKLHAMFAKCKEWEGKAKPGRYPDCDMLPVGVLAKNEAYEGKKNRKSNLSKEEIITMMSLWGIFKSPLIIGGNLPELDDFMLSVLTNSEYMIMNFECYDSREFERVEQDNEGYIIWTASGDKCKYAALFNTSHKKAEITLKLSSILMPGTKYKLYDIWEMETLGDFKDTFTVEIKPHAAMLLKIE